LGILLSLTLTSSWHTGISDMYGHTQLWGFWRFELQSTHLSSKLLPHQATQPTHVTLLRETYF
ncbi:hypothetical protein ACQP3D_28345, partial [Escherichia coli]